MKVNCKGETYIVTVLPKGKYNSYQVIREKTGREVNDKTILPYVVDKVRREIRR